MNTCTTKALLITLVLLVISLVQATTQPTSMPSAVPSGSPTTQPSGSPTCRPTAIPTRIPSSQPSEKPSMQPSTQPSNGPTTLPTSQPTRQPSVQPTSEPTSQPSRTPSGQPSAQPSGEPSAQPSTQPFVHPSSQPTRQPSRQPSLRPSTQPSKQPSGQPSGQPSRIPSCHPSKQPSTQPSANPSVLPSMQPSAQPSSCPSSQPWNQPSNKPSIFPSSQPSTQPSRQPSEAPTSIPSLYPSVQPSTSPSSQPTNMPSRAPSTTPSTAPSREPTRQPSKQPSIQPSLSPSCQPSVQPSDQPTIQPTSHPSLWPTLQPTNQPSRQPTQSPSKQPTVDPTKSPSSLPTMQPSRDPTMQPSCHPSRQPAINPTGQPSAQPSGIPTIMPSTEPSHQPTRIPTNHPSAQPSKQPTSYPSVQPSRQPSRQPSTRPSMQPTTHPITFPTGQPSRRPTHQPSRIPSSQPSRQPVARPTCQPSRLPTSQPTQQPSTSPTRSPSYQPNSRPSTQPSVFPSRLPSAQPVAVPSSQPTREPSADPSTQPSVIPSCQPTRQPSTSPTNPPSSLPSQFPSSQPSIIPSKQPSRSPSNRPSLTPSSVPSTGPSAGPSMKPSTQPSKIPSSGPTQQPSCQPSCQPSVLPTRQPSRQPSSQPSSLPSNPPSSLPSIIPSSWPSDSPSVQPSSQPTTLPTLHPTLLEFTTICVVGQFQLEAVTNFSAYNEVRLLVAWSLSLSAENIDFNNIYVADDTDTELCGVDLSSGPVGGNENITETENRQSRHGNTVSLAAVTQIVTVSFSVTKVIAVRPLTEAVIRSAEDGVYNALNEAFEYSIFSTQLEESITNEPQFASVVGLLKNVAELSNIVSATVRVGGTALARPPSSVPTQAPVTPRPTFDGETNPPTSRPSTLQPTYRPSILPSQIPVPAPTSMPSALPTCPSSMPSSVPTEAPPPGPFKFTRTEIFILAGMFLVVLLLITAWCYMWRLYCPNGLYVIKSRSRVDPAEFYFSAKSGSRGDDLGASDAGGDYLGGGDRVGGEEGEEGNASGGMNNGALSDPQLNENTADIELGPNGEKLQRVKSAAFDFFRSSDHAAEGEEESTAADWAQDNPGRKKSQTELVHIGSVDVDPFKSNVRNSKSPPAAEIAWKQQQQKQTQRTAEPEKKGASPIAAGNNLALMFVKPQATSSKVQALIDSHLIEHNVRVVDRGHYSGVQMARLGIFDRQFFYLKRYAEEVPARSLRLSAEENMAFDKFHEAMEILHGPIGLSSQIPRDDDDLLYGETSPREELTGAKLTKEDSGILHVPSITTKWSQMSNSQTIFNPVEASEFLSVGYSYLYDLWSKAAASASLATLSLGGEQGGSGSGVLRVRKGLYVTCIHSGCTDDIDIQKKLRYPIYLINGFYHAMKVDYELRSAMLHYIVIEWDSARYNWKNFEDRVIGASDPVAADPQSLRGIIYCDWKALGLKTKPTRRDNIVHVSGSALEGLAERLVWIETVTLANDPFAARLRLEAGVDTDMCSRWVSTDVSLGNKTVFDHMLHMGSDECVGKARQLQVFDLKLHIPNDALKNPKVINSIRASTSSQSTQVKTLVDDATCHTRLRISGDGAETDKNDSSSTEGSMHASSVTPRPSSSKETSTSQSSDLPVLKSRAGPPPATDSAVLLLKPGCTSNTAVFNRVAEILEMNDVRIISTGRVQGAAVKLRRIVEFQFTTLHQFAEVVQPSAIHLNQSEQDAFREKFGIQWEDVLAAHTFAVHGASPANNVVAAAAAAAASSSSSSSSSSSPAARKGGVSFGSVGNVRCFNAIDACAYLSIDAMEMGELWTAARVKLRLRRGLYIARIDAQCTSSETKASVRAKLASTVLSPSHFQSSEANSSATAIVLYVVNGFYAEMRRSYEKPDATIDYFVVEWNSAKLSWSHFQKYIIGERDPASSLPITVRGALFQEWKELGLNEQPSETYNGIRASASAFEAMVERLIWIKGSSLSTDIFGARLLRMMDRMSLQSWLTNPIVENVPLFTHLEGMGADNCLLRIRALKNSVTVPMMVSAASAIQSAHAHYPLMMSTKPKGPPPFTRPSDATEATSSKISNNTPVGLRESNNNGRNAQHVNSPPPPAPSVSAAVAAALVPLQATTSSTAAQTAVQPTDEEEASNVYDTLRGLEGGDMV